MDEFTRKSGMTEAEYLKRDGNKAITLKTLLETLDPLLDSIVKLEKADQHALLEGAAMKRLESLSRDLRNRGDAFAHSRPQVEGDEATLKHVRKNAPWLP